MESDCFGAVRHCRETQEVLERAKLRKRTDMQIVGRGGDFGGKSKQHRGGRARDTSES